MTVQFTEVTLNNGTRSELNQYAYDAVAALIKAHKAGLGIFIPFHGYRPGSLRTAISRIARKMKLQVRCKHKEDGFTTWIEDGVQ